MNHICKENYTCCCSTTALEPNEDCFIHGFGPWPPKCKKCGRFLKRGINDLQEKINRRLSLDKKETIMNLKLPNNLLDRSKSHLLLYVKELVEDCIFGIVQESKNLISLFIIIGLFLVLLFPPVWFFLAWLRRYTDREVVSTFTHIQTSETKKRDK